MSGALAALPATTAQHCGAVARARPRFTRPGKAAASCPRPLVTPEAPTRMDTSSQRVAAALSRTQERRGLRFPAGGQLDLVRGERLTPELGDARLSAPKEERA